MQEGCNKVVTKDEPNWCEHCDANEMMDQHICIDDGCNWCLYCADANEMITKEELHDFEIENALIHRKFLTAELAKVDKFLYEEKGVVI